MKVMSIFGTRPEMIKLWSTLRQLDVLNFEHVTVHTGQNFTPELKDFFFRDLELRAPDYQLEIDTSNYANEVADVIRKSDDLFQKVRPDALLILGDTHSGLSILPAAQRGIRIFHMEAGMRAWDTRMPEQRNRILIDHMSSVLLPFNDRHRENLLREGIHPSKIFVTGNPTFEAMRHFAPRIDASGILATLRLEPQAYVLATAHRSENVDDGATRGALVDALGRIAAGTHKTVVFSCHPRTAGKLGNTAMPKGVRMIAPLGFYDFNHLIQQCHCIVSDSGTAPEEALFYDVPSVTLRRSIERSETVEAGGTIVAGTRPEDIVAAVETAVKQERRTRYQTEDGFSPSSVVVNVLRSNITHYF